MYYIRSAKYTIQERQTKRGTVYDVVFRVADETGRAKQKRLAGYKTKREAKEAYAEFATGCVHVRRAHQYAADHKFADLAAEYLQVIAGTLKVATVYEIRRVFSRSLLPYFGKMRMSDIDRQALKRWQDQLWSRTKPDGSPYSYKSKDKERGFLSAFLTWASDAYGCDATFAGIKKPRERASLREVEIWRVEDFDKFIAVVDDPMYRCLFTLLFWTGRRKGELLALQPSDIKDGGTAIRWCRSVTTKTDRAAYEITTTKEDKVDTLPLCKRARDAIKAYEGQEPFFFGGDRPFPQNTLTKRYNRYVAAAGVKRIRLHDFRHSFVSMLVNAGASYQVVARLISDNVEQVILTYSHLYHDEVDRYINML